MRNLKTFQNGLRESANFEMRARGWSYPLYTEQAFEVLRACGYRVGVSRAGRVGYEEALRLGEIGHPKRRGRRLLWSERDVLALSASLERHRRWLPGSHRAKKTFTAPEAEAASFGVRYEVFTRWCEASAYDLVHKMAATADQATRRALRQFLIERSPAEPGANPVSRAANGAVTVDLNAAWATLLYLLEDEDDGDRRAALADIMAARGYTIRMEPYYD